METCCYFHPVHLGTYESIKRERQSDFEKARSEVDHFVESDALSGDLTVVTTESE